MVGWIYIKCMNTGAINTEIICDLRLCPPLLHHSLVVPQLPGCTPPDRPLVRHPRVGVAVLFLEVVGVSPAGPASCVGPITPRSQRRRPPPLMPVCPTTNSRVPTLPITRTVPLSAPTLHMQTMDTSKWHPRSSSFPSLFR